MALFAFYVAPGDWRDALVRRVTGSPYSHVELLQTEPINHATLCISASKRDGSCVRMKWITFKPGHWDFIAVPDLDPEKCWTRAAQHLGAPYDTIGAVLTVTPIVTSRPGKWFCSELLGDAAGIPQPHTLTPGRLAKTLKQMVEGDERRGPFRETPKVTG